MVDYFELINLSRKIFLLQIITVSIFTEKVLTALIFANYKIENFRKDKFSWIGQKSLENLAKINLDKN